jgi:hypothetical protein
VFVRSFIHALSFPICFSSFRAILYCRLQFPHGWFMPAATLHDRHTPPLPVALSDQIFLRERAAAAIDEAGRRPRRQPVGDAAAGGWRAHRSDIPVLIPSYRRHQGTCVRTGKHAEITISTRRVFPRIIVNSQNAA